ncbi:MAG TPA: hypothetical protein VFT13_02190, partial [Candidatus Krumholzibacteria bacterium]|nr:hypothetical protein [Candidatus Krumholzibacteria bacterium]
LFRQAMLELGELALDESEIVVRPAEFVLEHDVRLRKAVSFHAEPGDLGLEVLVGLCEVPGLRVPVAVAIGPAAAGTSAPGHGAPAQNGEDRNRQ